MQTCIILYDERINRYRRMQDISVLLDTEPTPELCAEMIECDILQKQAHEELCSYDKHKKFLYKHPLTINRQKIATYIIKIEDMRKKQPEEFQNEITNLNQNIRRIESNIRNKKYKDDATLKSWEINLSLAREKQKIISNLI